MNASNSEAHSPKGPHITLSLTLSEGRSASTFRQGLKLKQKFPPGIQLEKTFLKKQTLGEHKLNLVHTRIQEKGAVTPQELTQTCLWVSRSLQWRHESLVAWCRLRDTECSSVCTGPLEGGRHYPHHLHHSLASDQTTGREHSSTHQQKIGLKGLLSMALPIRTRPNFPHSQSLPAGSFHKPLILLHQRGDRMKTTTTEN